MVASGVWAGVIPLEKAHNLREVGGNGRTMKQELDRIGYLGEKDAHHQAIPLGVRCYDQLLLAIIDKLRPTSNYISVNIPPPGGSSFLGSHQKWRIYLPHVSGKGTSRNISLTRWFFVEQGPRLQAGNRRIGVVHGVQAYRVRGPLHLRTKRAFHLRIAVLP